MGGKEKTTMKRTHIYRWGHIKVVARLILNDVSFFNDRDETEGGKNEGNTGIVKSEDTGYDIKGNVVHSRIFCGSQKSSFMCPIQGLR